ncbi:MAG: hypothetical protein AUG45_02875 [Ktedonobacter sp. 13_1_20CM_3_54_15]|nr:MAG: hypothetical protein AUG45_02875 [Ktedonobacter sp. 13_1_20CM_3_54_15]
MARSRVNARRGDLGPTKRAQITSALLRLYHTRFLVLHQAPASGTCRKKVVWEGLCARLVEKGADMKRHEMSWTLTFVRLPFYTFEQQIREGCDRADLVSRKRLSSAIRRSSAVLGPT